MDDEGIEELEAAIILQIAPKQTPMRMTPMCSNWSPRRN